MLFVRYRLTHCTEFFNYKNVYFSGKQADEPKLNSRPPREGSTRLPAFPMVHIVKPNVGKKSKITFDEVPQLR